ncbi:MAG: ribonuclease HII [Candidatus Cloacimonetes bacterium]|nr:ribonuclease HII [Candidatus Cloacimonadota bacterium]
MLYQNEAEFRKEYSLIAGIDEAGRGPLAGPVVAAAVILPSDLKIKGLQDSKKLTPLKREKLYHAITSLAVAWSIGAASAEMIDRINILQATLHAMLKAASRLQHNPGLFLIDGNQAPAGLPSPTICCIKGDANYASIAAASIIAKVTRDRIMFNLDRLYPLYSWKKNKGYPTLEHRQAITMFGITPFHRKTFHLLS